MQEIAVEILADSISPQGHRVTSMLLTFPRFILAEAKTHRIISGFHGEVEVLEDVSINSFREGSKNSASSRAIPFEKMVKMVEEDPFIPIAWQKDHKGMQGTEYYTNKDSIKQLTRLWLEGRDAAVEIAKALNGPHVLDYDNPDGKAGVTKQLCNRLLEPFMWHTVLVTATEWENFFNLRCPKYYFEPSDAYFRSRKDFVEEYNATFKVGIDILTEMKVDDLTIEEWHNKFNHSQAEIHIQALAEKMWDAMNESVPRVLSPGMWHYPFYKAMPFGVTWEDAIKIATARCARLSYSTFDKEINYKKDLELHDRLLRDRHMSPFEHCLKAMSSQEYYRFRKGWMNAKENEDITTRGWCDNFQGWISYRYLIEHEV